MHVFISLDKYLAVELLGHRLGVDLVCRKLFQSGCTISHSHVRCRRIPVAPHHQQFWYRSFKL